MDNCIFCKIVAKQIPAGVVYEDDELLAFKDINPAAPVHLLVIPKQHVATLSDCTDDHAALLGKMLALAPKLAAEHGIAVKQGPDGGQEVYHLHLHVYGGQRPWRGLGT